MRHVALSLLGWLLLLSGILLGLVPFIPGWLLVVPGLIILKDRNVVVRWAFYWLFARFRWFRHMYKRMLPKVAHWLKK